MPKTLVATVTAKAGPGNTLTAGSFTNLKSLRFDTDNMLEVVDQSDKVLNLDISAATTFTVTVSSGNYTVVIS